MIGSPCLRRAGRILRVPTLEIGQVLFRHRALQPGQGRPKALESHDARRSCTGPAAK